MADSLYADVSEWQVGVDDSYPYPVLCIRLVVAAYGHNPPYHGKVAHQYTDGEGYGGGLPRARHRSDVAT